eukprot:PhM_4_TR5823/c0_g1_i1/m.30157
MFYALRWALFTPLTHMCYAVLALKSFRKLRTHRTLDDLIPITTVWLIVALLELCLDIIFAFPVTYYVVPFTPEFRLMFVITALWDKSYAVAFHRSHIAPVWESYLGPESDIEHIKRWSSLFLVRASWQAHIFFADVARRRGYLQDGDVRELVEAEGRMINRTTENLLATTTTTTTMSASSSSLEEGETS